jgi:hypothetical protein
MTHFHPTPAQIDQARAQFTQGANLLLQNPSTFRALPAVMRKTLIRRAYKLGAMAAAVQLQQLHQAH